jgi:hypothetical protein
VLNIDAALLLIESLRGIDGCICNEGKEAEFL